MIADRRMTAKVEIDEETSPEIEIKELTTKDIKCQQSNLIKISNLPPPALISVPDINTVNNFELYKAGSELNEMLQNWNSSLDFLMGGTTEDKKEGEDWNKISEIEKELEELEELMESVPNLKQ